MRLGLFFDDTQERRAYVAFVPPVFLRCREVFYARVGI